jgi:hypothetical protein
VVRLGAQRDGDHGEQPFVWQLAAVPQPGAQRAGTDGYDDVVDRDAEVVLDLLDLVECLLGEGDPPMGADRPVEGGARGVQAPALDDASVGGSRPQARGAAAERRERRNPGKGSHRRVLVEVRQRARQPAQRAHALLRDAGEAAGEHLELTGLVPADRCRSRGGQAAPLGRRVEQDAEDLGARHAIDGGMVHLGQDRHAVAVEAVDEVELPQWAGAIQRPGDDACDLLSEHAGIAGSGERQLADVELEVELGLVVPVGVVEAERHLDQSPVKRRQQVQASDHQVAHRVVGEPSARGGAGVIDSDRGDVAMGPAVLDGQELSVDAGELAHHAGTSSRDDAPASSRRPAFIAPRLSAGPVYPAAPSSTILRSSVGMFSGAPGS